MSLAFISILLVFILAIGNFFQLTGILSLVRDVEEPDPLIRNARLQIFMGYILVIVSLVSEIYIVFFTDVL